MRTFVSTNKNTKINTMSKTMQTVAKSKKAELSERLQAIASRVDSKMRMQWAIDNEYSLSTVDKYFSGERFPPVPVGSKLIADMSKLLGTSF